MSCAGFQDCTSAGCLPAVAIRYDDFTADAWFPVHFETSVAKSTYAAGAMFIGSGVSVFVSVLAFKLYTSAWHVRALPHTLLPSCHDPQYGLVTGSTILRGLLRTARPSLLTAMIAGQRGLIST